MNQIAKWSLKFMALLSLLVLAISYYSFSKTSRFKTKDWQLKTLTTKTQSEMIQLRELYYSLSLGELEQPLSIIKEIKSGNKVISKNTVQIKKLILEDPRYSQSSEKISALEKNLIYLNTYNKKMSIGYLSGYLTEAKSANKKASAISRKVLSDLSFVDAEVNKASNQSLNSTLNSSILSGLSTLLLLLLMFPVLNHFKKAKELADQASKEKSQFLANMSHEIRTPLNGIIGVIDLIQKNNPTEEQKHQLGIIEKSSAHLLNLINGILDSSKIEAGKLVLESINFDIIHSIENVCSIISTSAQKKNLDFSLYISKSVPQYTIGDSVKLNQVLVNLLNNAIKYTPAGKVSLSINSEKTENDFEQVLTIKISDSGVGIPQDKISNIFKPFVQTDDSDTRKYGGTGLGLSISKEIVELMGGKISVKSQEAKGSTFFLRIPFQISEKKLRTRPKEALSKVYSSSSKTFNTSARQSVTINIHKKLEHSKSYKILLTEDNLINQQVASMMLKAKGHDVTIAENGSVALELCQKHIFDLVLMDCQMPVMDGYEATRKIRSLERENQMQHTPIIAMTANALKKVKEDCFEAGMDEFITKPVVIEELTEIIDRVYLSKNNSKAAA